jgi:hypothetical protein
MTRASAFFSYTSSRLFKKLPIERKVMKRRWIAYLICIMLAAVAVHAQGADEGYQTARVVAFERVAADARHMESSERYKMSMRMGDVVYACHASAPAAVFIDWTTGKEFPAKVNGKVMLVKNPDGHIVELNIDGKKTAK